MDTRNTVAAKGSKFFDRDLSWLSFNYRVLLEATDKSLPLYERIKFLAIYSSNLDEFFRVRVASLRSLLGVKKKSLDLVGLEPEKLLAQIYAEVNRQQEEFGAIFQQDILPGLNKNDIYLLQDGPKEDVHKEFIEKFFEEDVFPFIHTELLRRKRIKHFLRENALYLAIKLYSNSRIALKEEKETGNTERRSRRAIIQIPTHYFPRFIELPAIGKKRYYMFLDDIIRFNLDKIFPGYEVAGAYSFKQNRNADLLIDDEYGGNLVEKIRKSLKRRQTGVPARFLYDSEMPKNLLRYLRDTFSLAKEDLLAGGKYHNFSDFFRFPNPLAPELEGKAYPPLPHLELESKTSMLDAISEKDYMVHFPYQSYDYVIRFLTEAANDPNVEAIHATQYRVAANSAVVNAMILAAQNGKKVSVFVELKARFDEALNLHSAEEMERAGVKIIYSFPGLKVHAKTALVLRKEGKDTKGYAFLSTGNFNEKTAKIYADHGFFSSDDEIINDLKGVFEHLEGGGKSKPNFKQLLVAQFNMRPDLEKLIDREIEHAKAGRKAKVLVKLNNLEDKKMIRKLYEASNAGVKITMIIRGICCLRPGIPGLSENIKITRLVDQFLEHARVFIFHNQGEDALYMGSADWMKRNLSRRIEVVFPIKDKNLKNEVIKIIDLQLADNVKAVSLDKDMINTSIKNDKSSVRAQIDAYELIKAGKLI
ncbi:MAG: polyphosphate kinase 1 [Bacteroidia bacterium]|nr:polyphosphate kinase 1 [Bacteroidia bacterium]